MRTLCITIVVAIIMMTSMNLFADVTITEGNDGLHVVGSSFGQNDNCYRAILEPNELEFRICESNPDDSTTVGLIRNNNSLEVSYSGIEGANPFVLSLRKGGLSVLDSNNYGLRLDGGKLTISSGADYSSLGDYTFLSEGDSYFYGNLTIGSDESPEREQLTIYANTVIDGNITVGSSENPIGYDVYGTSELHGDVIIGSYEGAPNRTDVTISGATFLNDDVVIGSDIVPVECDIFGTTEMHGGVIIGSSEAPAECEINGALVGDFTIGTETNQTGCEVYGTSTFYQDIYFEHGVRIGQNELPGQPASFVNFGPTVLMDDAAFGSVATPISTQFHGEVKAIDGLCIGENATLPANYLLAVDGKIASEEMLIKNSDQWPDYVFDENYDLPEINEVEQFIAEHKHLPEMPTCEEVSENGVAVGAMQAKLLQKVEELTLYMIELKKENEALRDEMSKLKDSYRQQD